jgi:hypothetical protein
MGIIRAPCPLAAIPSFSSGLRGTGKTLSVDHLNPRFCAAIRRTPKYLTDLVTANPKARHIVIDQKLPTLLEVVHLLIERKTGAQFIRTGSSASRRRAHASLHGGGAGAVLQPGTSLRQGTLPWVWAAEDAGGVQRALLAGSGSDGRAGEKHRCLRSISADDELWPRHGVESSQALREAWGR